MPDHTTAAAGPTLATDEIGGVHYPRTKLSIGADGVATDVSAANPMPVVNTPGGRTMVSVLYHGTSAVADTLLSLVKYTGGVAAAGVTTIAPTSGKTFRVTAIVCSVKAGAATAAFATFNLRINANGSAVIGTPSNLRIDVGSTNAVSGASSTAVVNLPEGFDFTAPMQLGISAACQATTNVLSVQLIGFEF